MPSFARFGLVAVLVLLACALAGPPSATAAAPPVVDKGTYLADVNAGAYALTRFGTILQNTQDLSDLKVSVPRARTFLTKFDRRMYVLSRYRLADPDLNRQRARLAHTGPPVTAVLSRFLDAAVVGDIAQVQKLLPAVTSRIAAFQKAAAG